MNDLDDDIPQRDEDSDQESLDELGQLDLKKAPSMFNIEKPVSKN